MYLNEIVGSNSTVIKASSMKNSVYKFSITEDNHFEKKSFLIIIIIYQRDNDNINIVIIMIILIIQIFIFGLNTQLHDLTPDPCDSLICALRYRNLLFKAIKQF